MATGRIGTTPVLQVRWSKAPTGGTTSLSGLDDNSVSLVYSVGYEAVYRNGVLLSRTNDYTATDGTTVTLIDATIAGDIIEIFANQTIPLSDTYSQTVANGKFINNTLTTTTGDIIYASAANTPARLGIGSTDQVLKVSGGVPTWAAPAAGTKSFTLLNTGGTALTGNNNITISSITGQDALWIIVVDASSANASSTIGVRFNSDTGTNYRQAGMQNETSNPLNYNVANIFGGDETRIALGLMSTSTSSRICGSVSVWGATSTNPKAYVSTGGGEGAGATYTHRNYVGQGMYLGTSAISSVTINSSTGNFDNGTVYVYGSA